ncbi:hypothetical protein SYNPS1DRAFT_26676 [Syncephalis pseudoplumigaleata]|uniref:Uncharacterized protein n=1 Tax=Syncephalis pseudoplumigaleata TaxID=1712513 RepID=A0A4P9Z574_9FUNG|nr:hypothetical protein SYNPS1DRAFT_26676 [Syncephalis pseudoplumigaleata]|eukprot:RKP27686.1 hypothetical protein SYNPS1DRAFT_26676 [Syncephalis pseudoplumigaleata]
MHFPTWIFLAVSGLSLAMTRMEADVAAQPILDRRMTPIFGLTLPTLSKPIDTIEDGTEEAQSEGNECQQHMTKLLNMGAHKAIDDRQVLEITSHWEAKGRSCRNTGRLNVDHDVIIRCAPLPAHYLLEAIDDDKILYTFKDDMYRCSVLEAEIEIVRSTISIASLAKVPLSALHSPFQPSPSSSSPPSQKDTDAA